MTHCHHTDCDERQTLGLPSPGPVVPDERIVRGAYLEKHYNKSGAVTGQFPRMKDIIDRCLSVWRIDQGLVGNLANARALVAANGPQNQTLGEAVIFDVNYLRAMTTLDGLRALCVFDDTVIDTTGNKHSEHAVIGLCRLVDPEPYRDSSNEVAVDLTRRLVAYANTQRQLKQIA
jgi:hypothetical protein